ncbi:MAG: ribonuclease D [Pirellula sp.]
MATDFHWIEDSRGLEEWCRDNGDCKLLGFDTEFVSEDSYRPELCLIQACTESGIAIIDPMSVDDLSSFWGMLQDPDRTVVVHAGREESLFSYRATEKQIPNLFDIQVAAGFLGFEYPASYAKLVQKVVGKNLDKEETRSDWRLRPLTRKQLEYAAQDVRDLLSIHEQFSQRLLKHGRLEWLLEETRSRQLDLYEFESSENWHRISGVSALSGTHLSIARGLWNWRDERAKERNVPARRILRDDLLVELARRSSTDPKHLLSLRGMEYRGTKPLIPEIAKVIESSKKDPPPMWPKRFRFGKGQPPGMLTQFLSAAMAFICHHKHISPMLVATADDLRDFVQYRLDGESESDPQALPSLLCGWRADLVGHELDELIAGKLAIVLDNPKSQIPIKFIPVDRR